MKSSFVRVQGEEFTRGGKPIVFRGFGVGSWLNLEHFMIGMPALDGMIRDAFADCFGSENAEAFWRDFTRRFCDERDFAFLKELGVNFIRVPFGYHLLIDDNNSEAFKPEGFAVLDRLVTLCAQYEIFVMLDLHATPGAQNPDWHSGSADGKASFWRYEVFRKQAVKLWRAIAARYANEPYLMGYDLLNEPFILNGRKELLHDYYEQAIAAIREVDQNHVILLEGDFFAMDFSRIGAFEDEQLALTFHYYPTVWNETLLDRGLDASVRRAEFDKGLAKVLGSMPKGYPLLCGEAGYELDFNDIAFSMELLESTLDIFEARGISWCIWDYKDTRIMGITHPKADSPWMQLAAKVKRHWDHHEVERYARGVMRDIAAHYPGPADETLLYHTQFQLRTILYQFEMEAILKPILRQYTWEQISRLPASFSFEHCDVLAEYCTLMRKYTNR